jgi:hypothetical protein
LNDSAPVVVTAVGEATLHFTECSHGTLTFKRNDTGASGTIPIQRLTPVPEACFATAAQ